MYKIKNPATGAKATAWKWFARYIKLRDALATTGTIERCRCITCGQVFDITQTDAGHMIPGRSAGILFDEEIVNGQCTNCNRIGGGEKQAYKRIMVEKYGIEWYEEKERARKRPVKTGEHGYKMIADYYRVKCHELENSCK